MEIKFKNINVKRLTIENIDPKNRLSTNEDWVRYQQKLAEYAGRTCYNSTDKITDDSYIKFIDMIKSKQHLSVLEHWTVLLSGSLKIKEQKALFDYFNEIQNDEGLRLLSPVRVFRSVEHKDTFYLITNYRYYLTSNKLKDIWYESDFISPLVFKQYKGGDAEIYAKFARYSFECEVPISISKELNRHRCLSPSEMSTRYISFNSGEDNKNYPMFSTPVLKEAKGSENRHKLESLFIEGYDAALNSYNKVKGEGFLNDTARDLIPQGLMSKVIYTGFKDAWKDIISKREIKQAHKNARDFVKQIKEEF